MRPSNLAVVTCYYDPLHKPERIAAWRRWNAGMLARGISPVTVEGVYAHQEPILCDEQGSTVMRVRLPDDRLCQKESLLNLVIRGLPATVDAICWCDGDVLIDFDGDWQEAVLDCLSQHEVCQPWQTAEFLGPDDEVLEWFEQQTVFLSAAEAVRLGKQGPDTLNGHGGLAWACTRHWFDAVGGLYSLDPTNGGDIDMVAWLFDFADKHKHLRKIGDAPREHIAGWGRKAFAELQWRGVGVVPDCGLRHLWHGARRDRRYPDWPRYQARYGFDPRQHLARDKNGLLRWTETAPVEMITFCRELLGG